MSSTNGYLRTLKKERADPSATWPFSNLKQLQVYICFRNEEMDICMAYYYAGRRTNQRPEALRNIASKQPGGAEILLCHSLTALLLETHALLYDRYLLQHLPEVNEYGNGMGIAIPILHYNGVAGHGMYALHISGFTLGCFNTTVRCTAVGQVLNHASEPRLCHLKHSSEQLTRLVQSYLPGTTGGRGRILGSVGRRPPDDLLSHDLSSLPLV